MRALICGSFDPPHNGHFDLIKRAQALFNVLIGIAENPAKPPLFSLEERAKRIFEKTGITPIPFSGMTTDFAKENHVDILVREIIHSGSDPSAFIQ